MTIVRMHYDRLECDSDEKKENGIEIEDVFRWIRISNLTFRILRGTGARARISRGVYRAFHPRQNRSNYTSIGYVITQKIFIGAYSPFPIRTSVSGLHFKGNFHNSDPG